MELSKINSALDDKYFAVQVESDSVTAIEKETFKVYSIPFTVNDKNGEVAFAYDNAAEKFMSVSDKDTGFSVDAVKQYIADYGNSVVKSAEKQYAEKLEKAKVDAVREVTDKYNALMVEYNEVKAKCAAAEQKIGAYAAAEKQAEKDAHKAKIDSVIASYDEQLGTNAEYVLYKNAVDYSKTVEQVENDMLIILGKHAKNGGNITQKFSANWGALHPVETPKPDRYGDLFDDFKD